MGGMRTAAMIPRRRHDAAAIAVADLFAPSQVTRLRARLRRFELDRAIAGGADIAASPLLAARAAQLVERRHRLELAAALEQAVSVSLQSGACLRTVPRREAMRRNRHRMLELAGILRSGRPAYARGVAVVELVLTDGAGPAYTDGGGEALARQLRLARERLGG